MAAGEIVFMTASVLSIVSSESQSNSLQCFLQPLPGPEVRNNFYNCSADVDWSNYISSECLNFGFDVQFLRGCTNGNLTEAITNTTDLIFPGSINDECLENITCFARIRARTLSSTYSAWTNISNSYEIIETCVVRGSGVCFPIVAKCEPRSILPDYIVNQDIHFLDEVLTENRTRLRNFGIVYNRNQSEYEACFMNITQDINFVEFCLHHSTCTSSIPSADGEFTILKSAKIKVGKDYCGGECCNPQSNEVFSGSLLSSKNSEFTANDHCVVIDFIANVELSCLSHSIHNVCISIVSPQNILQSTMIYVHLMLLNMTASDVETVLMNATQQTYCKLYGQTERIEISLIEADDHSIVYLPRPCINICNNDTSTSTNSICTTTNAPTTTGKYSPLTSIPCLGLSIILLSSSIIIT